MRFTISNLRLAFGFSASGRRHGSRFTPHSSRPTTPYSALGTPHLERAFSLIEILVTVALLSFIILGLLAVFNQTQRAFTSSMTQTDVLEAGRATMGQIAPELEMTVASRSPDYYVNGLNGAPYRATNFFVELTPGFVTPFLQELPGNAAARTNFIQRFFFLNKLNQDWIGIGYQVIPDDLNGYVGTLYRFASTNNRYAPLTLSGDFQYAANVAYQNARAGLAITNLTWQGVDSRFRSFSISRIADGVMDLRVRAFATNGFIIRAAALRVQTSPPITNGYCIGPLGPYTNVANTAVFNTIQDPIQSECYFMSNAVPGYVELEVGILEQGILKHYRGIPVPAAQGQYLSNHVAQLQLFRQRIAIRNVDFSAYPPYQ